MPKVLNQYKDIIPPDAVYIGRGSKWGNPYRIGMEGNRDQVCEMYEVFANETFLQSDFEELRGKDLICFCSPKRCHGDYLIQRANNV